MEELQFEKLYELNVNKKTEKKNNLTYLSWAWAWAEFVKVYPHAKYKVIKSDNGMPYFKDESGAFCYTEVTAGGLTHEMWLPVMDYKNQAIKNPTAFDINKTVMRCLTKNLAMFGLGLYIYAGEDLPEETHQEPIKAPSKAWSHDELKKKAGKEAKGAKHEFELSNGKIVTRKVAAKVAEKAGEVPKSVGKKLHSHDLRRAAGIKKKKM